MREWGIPAGELADYAAYLPAEAATPWHYLRDQEKAEADAKEALAAKPVQLPTDELDRRLGIPRPPQRTEEA